MTLDVLARMRGNQEGDGADFTSPGRLWPGRRQLIASLGAGCKTVKAKEFLGRTGGEVPAGRVVPCYVQECRERIVYSQAA